MQTEDPKPYVHETTHTTTNRVESTGPVTCDQAERVEVASEPEPQFDGMSDAADAVVSVIEALGRNSTDRETAAKAFETLRAMTVPVVQPLTAQEALYRAYREANGLR